MNNCNHKFTLKIGERFVNPDPASANDRRKFVTVVCEKCLEQKEIIYNG